MLHTHIYDFEPQLVYDCFQPTVEERDNAINGRSVNHCPMCDAVLAIIRGFVTIIDGSAMVFTSLASNSESTAELHHVRVCFIFKKSSEDRSVQSKGS